MVGQEIALSPWPWSIVAPGLQVFPFQPKTRPTESTARHKVVVGQDTPVRPPALVPVTTGSLAMDWGAEKAVPFQVRTAPLLSTNTQKVVVAQETALSCPPLSASPGWVHPLPSHTEGPPSAAMQKVGETQEIWLAAPQAPRLPLQLPPRRANEFPSPSMVMQKSGPVQSTAVKP